MNKLGSKMLCIGKLVAFTFVVSISAVVDSAESPEYSVLISEPDFEIRVYRESCWMSALEHGSVFQQSTKEGFHRLYQYIHGANSNSTKLNWTAPVLTTVVPSPQGSDFVVRYYLSAQFNRRTTPQPAAQLRLEMDKWSSRCVAVRNFSGFAREDNIYDERDALLSSLAQHSAVKIAADKNSFGIAQYSPPKQLTRRLNEVWINVQGSAVEGCPAN